jgi:prepilin-type processing-associated H-X9-DG protein
MSQSRGRNRLTLIEVMVTIVVIGVLMGLLVPALRVSTGCGRRAQCANNMRNIGLGILGYVNSNGVFPPAGMFAEDDATDVATPDPRTSVIPGWINGTGTRGVAMYSWVVPILPYIDQQEFLNYWTMDRDDPVLGRSCVSYLDRVASNPDYRGMPGSSDQFSGSVNNASSGGPTNTNFDIGNSSIGILRCPDDVTAISGEGNLSYVVNGGFALWHAEPYGWIASSVDGVGGPTRIFWAGLNPPSPLQEMKVCQQMGVMFLESTFPKGDPRKIPWNVRSRLQTITDGAGSTLLLSENTLAGVSEGSAKYSAGLPTNWATPMPQFSMFIGSSNVCTRTVPATAATTLDCMAGGISPAQLRLLAATDTRDGPAWSHANKLGTFENINFGQTLTAEGSFPFSNSGHSDGCNMMFCDGSVRIIPSSIDGTVYSKIITPAGSQLPLYAKQLPVDPAAFSE